ncbi:MAG: DUF87 domain-containing protein [Chloroflexi bacterium]|nr:DUF87 domain-containing protein [Chloroflexota bacterium]
MVKLFEPDRVVGTFKGFIEEGLEFRAEMVFPYRPSEELTPRIGQFILVELGSSDEAVIGRITHFVPVGIMAGAEGDEYVAEMMRESKEIPSQVKERRLRYNVRVKLLGGLRIDRQQGNEMPRFVPAVRKLPHLGSRVGILNKEVLSFLCGLGAQDASSNTIGFYSLGELIYSGGEEVGEDFLLPQPDRLEVKFDVGSLIAKRSFVFARAGYGKSNLMKLLISKLYERGAPKDKRGRPVGMLIFDPEGEYFWPDEDGRPGLCSVTYLKDRIAVFTDRPEPNRHFGSWRVGGIRLDIRRLRPSDVVSMCIAEDRQNQQNVLKLRGLTLDKWRALVDYISVEGHAADEVQIRQIAGFQDREGVESRAMRSNMVAIIQRLHSDEASLETQALQMLSNGMIVVVDLSLISGAAGMQISGLLLKQIFDHNQRAFTGMGGGLGIVPTIAVMEEAQSVLNKQAKDDSPFVQWVKEGRKYGLGSIMVTQQPGSLAPELLSQGDNFFAFHLLSAHDLKTLQTHNAHFSDDVLASLLNEPIKGNCYFWSAPDQPFVLPARILDFERLVTSNAGEEIPSESIETKAGSLSSEGRRAEQELANIVREMLVGHQVEFYALDSPQRGPSAEKVVACYGPRLAARVAEQLADEMKTRFCSSNAKFVGSAHLERALIESGCVKEIRKMKAARSGKSGSGDYYLIAEEALGAQVECKEALMVHQPDGPQMGLQFERSGPV